MQLAAWIPLRQLPWWRRACRVGRSARGVVRPKAAGGRPTGVVAVLAVATGLMLVPARAHAYSYGLSDFPGGLSSGQVSQLKSGLDVRYARSGIPWDAVASVG